MNYKKIYCFPSEPLSENERKLKNQQKHLSWQKVEQKSLDHEGDCNTDSRWNTWNDP